jgi:DNA-binding PadR family transcriptional regulator
VGGSQPLTDLAFNILVALKDEELHGYALLKHLQGLEGRASLRTGTVYAALARLQDDGLVAPADSAPGSEDERRRYYRVTEAGLAQARAEAARLADVLARAGRKDLISRPSRG